jgi:hypothetical protein
VHACVFLGPVTLVKRSPVTSTHDNTYRYLSTHRDGPILSILHPSVRLYGDLFTTPLEFTIIL